MKGIQSEWKEFKASERSSERVKRRSRRTELKVACERIRESDKSKARKGRRLKRRGLCERLLGRFVCYSSLFLFVRLLFVPGEDSRKRKELNFNK